MLYECEKALYSEHFLLDTSSNQFQVKAMSTSYDELCASASSAAELRLLDHFVRCRWLRVAAPLLIANAVRCVQKQFGGEVWEIGSGCEACRVKSDDPSALKVRLSLDIDGWLWMLTPRCHSRNARAAPRRSSAAVIAKKRRGKLTSASASSSPRCNGRQSSRPSWMRKQPARGVCCCSALHKKGSANVPNDSMRELLQLLSWSMAGVSASSEPTVVGVAKSLAMDASALPGWFFTESFDQV